MKNNFLNSSLCALLFVIGGLNMTRAQVSTIGLGSQTLADKIVCSCNLFHNCKASGSSGVCAQSEEGQNIQCSSYNSNC